MSADAWAAFHRRWSKLKPPLRASADVVETIRHSIENRSSEVLLLGVTPELADMGARMVALDWSQSMIDHIWPGDSPTRRAMLADWRSMPFDTPRFSAVIGDGSFNCLVLADVPMVFHELSRVLSPGARLAVRVYATPSPCESLESLQREVMTAATGGFHGFKWRLAMALAAETGNAEVAVSDVFGRFEALFPDRAALAHATGWSEETIGEIDAYCGSDAVYIFPTVAQVLAAIPAEFRNAGFISSGAYDLAERCPILIADFEP